jgi:hypothetical protein
LTQICAGGSGWIAAPWAEIAAKKVKALSIVEPATAWVLLIGIHLLT